MSSQQIWYKDLKGFVFNENTMFTILPDFSMSLAEQLNATVRFVFYFCILLLIIKKDPNVLYYLLGTMLITYMIYKNYETESDGKRMLLDKMNVIEDFKDRKCVKPTRNNPFMNVMLGDYIDFPSRPEACDPDIVEQEISDYFEIGLNRDENDIFKKTASDRQFFTNPITTIPNDRGTFVDWLYKTGPTKKESGI